MSDSPLGVRQRPSKKKSAPSSTTGIASGDEDESLAKTQARKVPVLEKPSPQWGHKISLFFVTVFAFVTRFYKISHPDQVVFDEVHFGKVSLGD